MSTRLLLVAIGLVLLAAVLACAWLLKKRIDDRFDRLEKRLEKRLAQQRPATKAVPKAGVKAGSQPQQGKRKGKGKGGLQAQQRRERDRIAKRVQDIVTLFEMVPIRSGLPALGLWTASADLLVELVDRVVHERPTTVVEGGSGVSTVVMALAAKEHGLPTRIVALEHQEAWAEHTRAMLERHGVADHAEVRLAPLAPTSLEGHETPWYDASALADLTDVGLVLVDGPPEGTGPRARYPMVPLLQDQLAARCTILVDDTDRPGDADVVERWRPLLPDFEFEVLRLDKGAALLTRR